MGSLNRGPEGNEIKPPEAKALAELAAEVELAPLDVKLEAYVRGKVKEFFGTGDFVSQKHEGIITYHLRPLGNEPKLVLVEIINHGNVKVKFLERRSLEANLAAGKSITTSNPEKPVNQRQYEIIKERDFFLRKGYQGPPISA